MGWFDWLFNGKQDPDKQMLDNIIWFSEDGKFAGLQKAINETRKSIIPGTPVSAVILVAHFQDTWQRLDEVSKLAKPACPVEVVYASDLSTTFSSGAGFDHSGSIDFLIGERHPSRGKDDQLVEMIHQLTFPTRIQFYVSLDDATMRRFSGDFVRKILEQGGFSDENPLMSSMVDRRIRTAQMMLDKHLTTDQPATSAERWMALNGVGRFLGSADETD